MHVSVRYSGPVHAWKDINSTGTNIPDARSVEVNLGDGQVFVLWCNPSGDLQISAAIGAGALVITPVASNVIIVKAK